MSKSELSKTFILGSATMMVSFLALFLAFIGLSSFMLINGANANVAVHNGEYKATGLFSSIPEIFSSLGTTSGENDARIAQLTSYLEARNSPMVEAVPTFLSIADACPFDWTLLPAIAGKESTFGRFIPPGSYNAFGWAVYTGQTSGAVFTSWDHAVEVVGRGLCENYIKQGRVTPEQIEVRYTPPSAQGHGHWRKDVAFMMEQIRNWQP